MSLSLLVAAGILPAWSKGAEVRSEFVFEQAPFAECHASTIVETVGGDFLVAWFGGSSEGENDVAIWMSRLSKGRWSPPASVARENGVPVWNPVLFRGADQRLWLFYKAGSSPETWTAGYKTSIDDGKSWSDTSWLPAGLLGPIKNKPIRLASGDIVAGSSVESYRSWTAWVERSTDGGKTWTKFGPIVIPGEPYGIIQPTLVELLPNQLRLFARSRQGFIFRADSSDGGRTWTAARPTSLPNPNSGIDGVKLDDTRLLMVYNNSGTERTPLCVALSADGGDTWRPLVNLETEKDEFSYPAVIQSTGGDVHIVYTWRRKRIKHVVIPRDSLSSTLK